MHDVRDVADKPKLWLRQLAGVSAGSATPLRDGVLELGPSRRHAEPGGTELLDLKAAPLVPVFRLHINGTAVRLEPVNRPIEIEGRPVSANTKLRPGQLFGAGADLFLIETKPLHRPKPSKAATGPLLITGSSRTSLDSVLASLATDLLANPMPKRRHLYIIDSGERPLIRLRQLKETQRYVAGDEPDAVARLLQHVSSDLSQDDGSPVMLIVNNLGPLLAFLRAVGCPGLAQRLLLILSRHDRVRLTAAATGPTLAGMPNGTQGCFRQHLVCLPTGCGALRTPDGTRVVSLAERFNRDVNAAVAQLQ